MSNRQGNLLGKLMQSGTILAEAGRRYIAGAIVLVASTCGSVFAATPSFNGGSSQTFTVCRNATGAAINGQMTISDADMGDAETWSITIAPSHGTLGGFPLTLTSTGGTLAPTTLTYTPITGYSGIDSFAVQVSDGSSSAFTMVYVTVNAGPTLSSTLTPPAICNGATFSYTPTSSSGTSFSWYRNNVPGISNASASGTGNPNESLGNYTNYDVTATYNYTLTSGGCTNHQNVDVVVHPTPRLSSASGDTICSGSTFAYTPTSYIPGASITWSRASVTGINPPTSSGSGNISEVLTNSAGTPVTAVYAFTISAGSCVGYGNVNVLIAPPPTGNPITTASGAAVCAGASHLNFGATTAPLGMTYTWHTQNATLNATGGTSQYCLVSFPNAGDAYVTLTMNGGTNCLVTDTYAVHVGSSLVVSPSVIYYNYQLVCLDNTLDSYQWGFDNAYTLDSSAISGANAQSYVLTTPDFFSRYYWVITMKNGCMQKTYYNGPTATGAVQSGPAAMRVYPDPAQSTLTIETGAAPANHAVVVVTDALGREVMTQDITTLTTQMNVADLAAGSYFINYIEKGQRTATARFMKN